MSKIDNFKFFARFFFKRPKLLQFPKIKFFYFFSVSLKISNSLWFYFLSKNVNFTVLDSFLKKDETFLLSKIQVRVYFYFIFYAGLFRDSLVTFSSYYVLCFSLGHTQLRSTGKMKDCSKSFFAGKSWSIINFKFKQKNFLRFTWIFLLTFLGNSFNDKKVIK